MCHTALITDSIANISTRSLRHTLMAASGKEFTKAKLAGLNRSLDSFYELMYDQYNSITRKDYKIIGPQMKILLDVLKNLYSICYKMASPGSNLAQEVDRLGRNYSAIYEINSDIKHFRLPVKQDEELTSLLRQASCVISKIG